MQPRILLASFIPDRAWTGMGKWSHRIAEELRALGMEPTLWWSGDFPRVERAGRLAVLAAPAAVAARIAHHRDAFDAVVLHEPLAAWYGVWRRALPTLPPLVLMCHNVEGRAFAQLRRAAARGFAHVPRGTRIKTPLFRTWQSLAAIAAADQIVCLSSGDRAYLERVRPGAVTRIVNGVTAARFRPPASREGMGTRVLFIGGWVDVKGRRVLPHIWRAVRRERPDAALTLIGTGAPIERVADEFSADDRESLTVISSLEAEQEIADQLAAHDVLLMPSLSEGSPLVLLEAMAAGLPIAASRVGGIPDAVVDGEHAVLFDALDAGAGARAVIALLADGPLRTRLTRAARRRAEALTWRRAAAGVAAAVEAARAGAR